MGEEAFARLLSASLNHINRPRLRPGDYGVFSSSMSTAAFPDDSELRKGEPRACDALADGIVLQLKAKRHGSNVLYRERGLPDAPNRRSYLEYLGRLPRSYHPEPIAYVALSPSSSLRSDRQAAVIT